MKPIDDILLWLLDWHHQHSNLDKKYEIKIGTFDNPGWYLEINLENTELQDKIFPIVNVEQSSNDWFYCSIEKCVFGGYGGPFNLPNILEIFGNWVTQLKKEYECNDNFIWLLKWFNNQCDGNWEHGNGIQIKTLNVVNWSLMISLEETELQNRSFQEIKVNRNNVDWIHCYIEDDIFRGKGGSFNLVEILQVFRNWAENDLNSMDVGKSQP